MERLARNIRNFTIIAVIAFCIVAFAGAANDSQSAYAGSFKNTYMGGIGMYVQNDDELNVSWFLNYKFDGYQLYRATSKNGKFKRIADVEVHTTEYLDKTTKYGKTYYYKYRGYKYSKGKKIYTNFSKVCSKKVLLGEVKLQTAEFNKDGSITITFDRLKHADGYKIYTATNYSKKDTLLKTIKGNENTTATIKIESKKDINYIIIKGYVTINGKKYYSDEYTSYYFQQYSKYYDAEINGDEQLKQQQSGLSEIDDRCIENPGAYYDLTISNCTINSKEDLKFLEKYIRLKYLHFKNCTFTNLDVLEYANKSKIKSLSFDEVPLKSFDGIETFEKLESLLLEEIGTKSLNGLANQKSLENLYLYGIEVESFQFLRSMPKLKYAKYVLSWYDIDDSTGNYIEKPGYEMFHTHCSELIDICEAQGIELDSNGRVENTAIAERVCDEFIAKNITSSMSDYEKIKTAHDFILNYITYDSNYETGNNVWETHIGVCHHYATSFQYLVERMGIDCYYVTDVAGTHAWNIVELNGRYYHVDCTWDDTGGGSEWEYFLISDSTMNAKRNYPWDTSAYPVCPQDYASAA